MPKMQTVKIQVPTFQWAKFSIEPDENTSQSGLTSFWKSRKGAANILNITDNEIQLFRLLWEHCLTTPHTSLPTRFHFYFMESIYFGQIWIYELKENVI